MNFRLIQPSKDASRQDLIREILAELPDDGPFDVQAVLRERPKAERTVVLNLALEDYIRRKRAGQSVVLSCFIEGYPGFENSLRDLVQVYEFLEAGPNPPASTTRWPEVGSEFCGFLLLEEIGRGAFSRVHIAREPLLADRLVVVKVCDSFGREAEGRLHFHHDNVVPLLSAKVDAEFGLTALVMPFQSCVTVLDVLDLPGETREEPSGTQAILEYVRQRNARFRPTSNVPAGPELNDFVSLVFEWAFDVASVLRAAHLSKTTHGDLKPSNLLLTDEGRLKLLDFNLSQTSGDDGTPIVGGTIPYLAPEQLEVALSPRANSELDRFRADIFQFGATFAHIVTGEPPFSVEHSDGERSDILRAAYKSRHSAPRFAPKPGAQRLFRILTRCLEFDPNNRFADADELFREINGALSERQRIHSPRAVASSRGGPSVSRRVALIVGGTGVVALGWTFTNRPRVADLARTTREAYLAKDFRLAMQLATQWSARTPYDPLPRLVLNMARLHLGERDRPFEELSVLLAGQERGRASAMLAYGHLLPQPVPKLAVEAGLAAISEDCGTAAVVNNLGVAFQLNRQSTDAEAKFREALALAPERYHPWLNLAILESAQSLKTNRQPDTSWIRRAIEISPEVLQVRLCAAAQYALMARAGEGSSETTPSATSLALAEYKASQALGASSDELRGLEVLLPDLKHGPKIQPPAQLAGTASGTKGVSARIMDPLDELLTIQGKHVA
jgi:serine/threonine protein kinase